MMIFNSQVGNIEVLMLKGEKADPPVITETPIDNGYRVTIDDVSFDLHNATSGDYLGLTNKPSINSVLLSGNKTGADLGLIGTGDLVVIDKTMVVPASIHASDYIDMSDYGIADISKWAVIGFWCGYNGNNTYPRFVTAMGIFPDGVSFEGRLNPCVEVDLYTNSINVMIRNDWGTSATFYYRIVLLRVSND